jgi:uncharacterized protein YndB with AHSA1/START domain
MTSDARVLGQLIAVDGRGTVLMRDRFTADIDSVWTALTAKEHLARWLGDFTGDLRAGSIHHAHFHASGAEGDRRIDECHPPTRFRVTALDEAGQEGQVVDVTLQPDGDGTIVALAQSGLPLTWIAAFGAGMQIHFEDLALHLAGKERSDADTRMGELMPLYEMQAVTPG